MSAVKSVHDARSACVWGGWVSVAHRPPAADQQNFTDDAKRTESAQSDRERRTFEIKLHDRVVSEKPVLCK